MGAQGGMEKYELIKELIAMRKNYRLSSGLTL